MCRILPLWELQGSEPADADALVDAMDSSMECCKLFPTVILPLALDGDPQKLCLVVLSTTNVRYAKHLPLLP